MMMDNPPWSVLVLFTVGDVYASLCKKSVYAPLVLPLSSVGGRRLTGVRGRV